LSSFSEWELREIFNVSEMEVFPIKEYEDFEVEAKGGELQLVVVLREGERNKCERCWLRRESVGEDPDFPDLCVRCAEIVKRLRSEGRFLGPKGDSTTH